MKKILSCVLAAAMLVGMLAVGAVAEETNTVLKFNDIPMSDGGGNVGMANYMGAGIDPANGYTVVMDFTYGRSGPCYHPTDATMAHTSKFAFNLGLSEGTHKYVGYSADKDAFFLATCVNSPIYGETVDGMEYLALSETGLIQPGISYKVAYEFFYDTGINIYVDGTKVLSYDLYDLDYPTYFAHSGLMMYPTHITCTVDNLALYANGTYNAETSESTADPVHLSTFEDAKMVTIEEKDEDGNVTGTVNAVSVPGWQIVTEAYSLADPTYDVYNQPNYVAAEGQTEIVFQSGLDKKANGADEVFASGVDFKIALSIKNNAGLDSLKLDLVQDPYITVKSVEAADGLTATLGETDENGVTALTVTGSDYKGEALATITYTLDVAATQNHWYRYGALVDTMEITGAATDAVITSGMSKVYNYTVGDLNDDGNFNLADVALILKIAAKWDLPGVFAEAGEVNGDGRTNGMDASYYLKWLAKWSGYSINGITYY